MRWRRRRFIGPRLPTHPDDIRALAMYRLFKAMHDAGCFSVKATS